MAIQVIEFEMSKPSTRVTKPVKGANLNFEGMMGGMSGIRRMGSMEAFGGMMNAMMPRARGMQGMGGMPGLMGDPRMMGAYGRGDFQGG